MMARPAGLPDFQAPPVTEVAFSLQFDVLPRFTAPYIGLLWQKFREALPEIEEHAPLAEALERFGLLQTLGLEVQFEDKPPVPRVWFLNADKTNLIQVQSNRFIHNWRKLMTESPYPRYEAERATFLREARILEAFLAENDLGSLRVNQCELTYVNHIEPAGGWKTHADAPKVFTVLRPAAEIGFLPEREDSGFRLRYVMGGGEGDPLGRLHAVMNPGWRTVDQLPVFTLSMMARGAPIGTGLEGAFRFFDIGREWIVKGFAELTTKEMHHVWGRIDS